jgi:FtsP/CotA-like multicopper oxidase with cupredoxin domain
MSNDRTQPLRSVPARSAARLSVMTFGRAVARRWCVALPALVVALGANVSLAQADGCPSGEPFFPLPEIVSQPVTLPDGKKIEALRGTMLLTDTQVLMMTRFGGGAPGTPGAVYDCVPQTVRAFRSQSTQRLPNVAGQTLPDPYPGPVLRARLGDIVQLTFVNNIDPARFPQTSESSGGNDAGCDVVVGLYPGPDTYPDCFHGSSTGNIHFHGTHTNPNGTGDNVLLEVRPSPRDAYNQPTITPFTYAEQFEKFFTECAEHLVGNPLAEWPTNWNGPDQPGGSSLGPWDKDPHSWTAIQQSLLTDSDQTANKQVPPNEFWPQYYIGAYPYCFQIPQSTATSFPPPSGTLQMGQAPGTHWYHAHKHGTTAIDVANGMVGALIIEGASYDGELNRFYGGSPDSGWTRTQPVMVINQPGTSPNKMRNGGAASQDKGPDFVVNGRFQSIIDMAPGQVQMWRIVNGSGRSGALLSGFPSGFRFRQIAQDGVQFADANYQASENRPLLIASGNRADLLVKASTVPGIYPLMVQHDVDPSDVNGNKPAFPVILLMIRVNPDLPPVPPKQTEFIDHMPPLPTFLDNITTAEANATRTAPEGCVPLNPNSSSPCGTANNPRVVQFASTSPRQNAVHTIDGLQFSETNPKDVKHVTLSTVEEWQIENATANPNISHPFHIHINPFQIVEVFDPNETVQAKDPTTGNVKTADKYVAPDKIIDASVQCPITADQSTWKDCHNDETNDKPQRVWWDVFPIPSGRKITFGTTTTLVPGHFRMRSRFVDFPGEYVIHCHILAHEDRGMMAIVNTQPANAPQMAGRYHHH